MSPIDYSSRDTVLLMLSGATLVSVMQLKEDETVMEMLNTHTYQDIHEYIEENY